MARRERDVLDRAAAAVAAQAATSDRFVDEALAADGRDHPFNRSREMLRLELLKVKADLERELATLGLTWSSRDRDVHEIDVRHIDKRTPRPEWPGRSAVRLAQPRRWRS